MLAQLADGDLVDLLGVAGQGSNRLDFPDGAEWRTWLRSCSIGLELTRLRMPPDGQDDEAELLRATLGG